MLTLDAVFFAFAVPATVFAGISKGGFGSGASFASAVILAVILEPTVALGVMLPLLLLIDLASLRPYWGQWSAPESKLLILTSVPGVVLGVLFLSWANADVLRVMIGTVALLFIVWLAVSRRGWISEPRAGMPAWVGAMCGCAAGFTSFVSHAGGPLAAVYLLGRGLDKTAYQATSVIVFFAINVAKFGIYGAIGLFTPDTLWAGVYLAPAALIGTWIGVRAHRIVSEAVFFGLTYALLAVTGAKLVLDGLT